MGRVLLVAGLKTLTCALESPTDDTCQRWTLDAVPGDVMHLSTRQPRASSVHQSKKASNIAFSHGADSAGGGGDDA